MASEQEKFKGHSIQLGVWRAAAKSVGQDSATIAVDETVPGLTVSRSLMQQTLAPAFSQPLFRKA
jgi:hypothetical protein